MRYGVGADRIPFQYTNDRQYRAATHRVFVSVKKTAVIDRMLREHSRPGPESTPIGTSARVVLCAILSFISLPMLVDVYA